MKYEIINENKISDSLHSHLKKSLCLCFPKDVNVFSKITYWRSIPSFRVFWRENETVISHIAVIDRTITVGEKMVCVAGIQSVFILPDYRGGDICREMFDLLIEEAHRRGFDYSVLFCVPKLEPVYQHFGYRKIENAPIVFTNGQDKEQKLGSREIVMWRSVCRNEFPAGNISLNGDKW